MSCTYRTKTFFAVVVSSPLLSGVAGVGRARAHSPDSGDHSHDAGHASHDPANHGQKNESAERRVHGGQVSAAGQFQFEVFFAPQETRICAYDARRRPISVRGMRGEVIMRLRGNDGFSRLADSPNHVESTLTGFTSSQTLPHYSARTDGH